MYIKAIVTFWIFELLLYDTRRLDWFRVKEKASVVFIEFLFLFIKYINHESSIFTFKQNHFFLSEYLKVFFLNFDIKDYFQK